jgi:hypothetical protein
MTKASQRLFGFLAGRRGPWIIQGNMAVIGEALPAAERLLIVDYACELAEADCTWHLEGVTSHDRYVTRDEKNALLAQQPPLGRLSADCAAFIAVRKSSAWWALTQDERRNIIEDQSQHIALGMRYLPAIARRLHHCRDLQTAQPFDFLTWFEFAITDIPAFDQLLKILRASIEWQFVEREIDLRLVRARDV